MKKIIVFQVTGLKTLGRVGTHIFLNIFFWKKYNFMHFERQRTMLKCISISTMLFKSCEHFHLLTIDGRTDSHSDYSAHL